MIRWVGPWDKWLVWDGTRWRIDLERRIDALAKDTAADLWHEIATAGNGVDRRTLDAMTSWAKYSWSARGVANLVALARSEADIAIAVEALDKDPWLLNAGNGTIDLRTGKLRPHRMEDYLTKILPVAYNTKARCLGWKWFLRTIFADNTELIGYIQRLVGYSLTGATQEHILPFLYGVGANGKSTFCETILRMLGTDYGMKAAPDLLMSKRGDSHPTDRADLWGKRFVACIETEEGRRIAEALTKELTGGDRVRARRMREDFWEFAPTHHVWLAGNHKPTITGTDHGIWRRIKLVPFSVVIPEDKQEKDLPAILARELPGILSWAIEGCLDWQRDGMREPDIVRAATKGYAEEEDEVGEFLAECCEEGPDYVAPATELFRAFVEATESQLSQKAFGKRLKQRGYDNDSRLPSGRKAWKGLRLRPEPEPEEAEPEAE